jgi:ceramide glucosyltransferase
MLFILYKSIIILSFSILSLYLAATIWFRPRRRVTHHLPEGKKLPKVSIFKPVNNVDDGMEENFKSFFELDYPDYEIIFGIDTDDKSCWHMVERVTAGYPEKKVKIINTISEKILNPKITTLLNMEKYAEGDIFWLTDSNVRVDRATLMNLVAEYLEHDSKIVFSPIKGTGSKTFASLMENTYLNFFVSGNIITGWYFLKKEIIVGKSMLVEKQELERIGGFEFFREYLAEDYVMGRVYSEMNIHISSNFTWVTNYISTAGVRKFFNRVARWSKIRYNTERLYYFPELITNPIILSLPGIFVFGDKGVALALWVVVFKILIEYINFLVINDLDRKKLTAHLMFPLGVIVKDFLLFGVYIEPFFNKNVTWRGRSITIDNKGRIVHISG